MEYEIKRLTQTGEQTILTAKLEGGQQRGVMSQNIVVASFVSSTPSELYEDDYVDVWAERYWLKNPKPAVKKVSDNEFQYSFEFQGIHYRLSKSQFLFYDNNNVLKKSTFTLNGNADTFLDLIVANANRLEPGWTKGRVEVDDIYKNLQFKDENCLSVLSRISDEYDTEWWVDPDKKIHLGKRTSVSGAALKYGRYNGLYDISRTVLKTDLVTRLYPYGGSKNLPANYRNYNDTLQLPVSVTNGYLENNTDKYKVKEASKQFEEIYPHREGTITAVNGLFKFSDDTLDFDINQQLITKVSAKIHFQTGQMAGYEFEIAKGGYNHSTKEITILKNQNEKALELPSDNFRPAVGDKYVLLDIIMPDAYIFDAEQKLLQKANEFLLENSEAKVSYQVTLNAGYVKERGWSILLGQTVLVEDAALQVNELIRVVAINRSLQDWYDYSIELSNSKITVPSTVKTYQKIEKANRAIIINELTDPNKARMSWLTSQELLNLVFDPDGDYFSEKIKPLSIETTMIAVGARSQQFLLNGIVFEPNYLGNKNRFHSSPGTLVHYTIADDVIKSWILSDYTNDQLTDNTAYIIYAKCQRNSTTGSILLTNQHIVVDQDPDHYHFVIGVLHSVFEGVRGISLTYGQTTINGKFIKTGVIFSQDGKTFFNLDTGEIGGRIKFLGTDGNYNTVDSLIEQALADYQPDAQIVLWDGPYVPTLTNAPANTWTTDAIRDDHIGDLFYNTVTDIGYKFTKGNNGVYSWVVETNNGVLKAMKAAAQAQDTADGKRRLFLGTVPPVPPYDRGDQWAQGPTGDILVANVAKAAGELYSPGDWGKGSKYTDDTVATAAQNAANTANTRIAEIANDNMLTPGEKQFLLKEWQTIQGEKPIINGQAVTYGVSTASYDSAYNTLDAYITPLLTNLTVNSNITGATLRANFKSYYDAKVSLLKAITDRAKQNLDTHISNLGGLAYDNLVSLAKLDSTVIDGGFLKNTLINTNYLIVNGVFETPGQAQARVNNLANTLGDLAYTDVVQASQLGSTIIVGGFINTSLINVNTLRAQLITADNINAANVNFTQGIIGGWNMSLDRIKAGATNSIELVSGSSPQIRMINPESSASFLTAKSLQIASAGEVNNNVGNGVIVARRIGDPFSTVPAMSAISTISAAPALLIESVAAGGVRVTDGSMLGFGMSAFVNGIRFVNGIAIGTS